MKKCTQETRADEIGNLKREKRIISYLGKKYQARIWGEQSDMLCLLCRWPCEVECASYHTLPNACWLLHLFLHYRQDRSVWPWQGWERSWV